MVPEGSYAVGAVFGRLSSTDDRFDIDVVASLTLHMENYWILWSGSER